MAKRDDLRRKLKAADRRRQRRRPPPSDPPPRDPPPRDPPLNPGAADPPRRDVTGRVVAEILAAADAQRHATDAAALRALRGCVRRLPPNDPLARALYDRLQQIVADSQASERELRRAAEELLELARQQSGGSGHGDDFLRYLAVLAS